MAKKGFIRHAFLVITDHYGRITFMDGSGLRVEYLLYGVLAEHNGILNWLEALLDKFYHATAMKKKGKCCIINLAKNRVLQLAFVGTIYDCESIKC